MQRLGEPLLQRPDDEAAHEACIAKAHFRLGGMDVDVDLGGSHSTNSASGRVPVGGQEIDIGRPHRAGENLVAHGAAVDEHILRQRVRPAEGRQADPPVEPHALARRLDARANSRRIPRRAPGGGVPPGPLRRRRRPASRRQAPISVEKAKRASGWPSARRLTTSATACASLRSDFRNLSRAGVAANRSRASTRVPIPAAQGSTGLFAPSSTTSRKPVGAPSVRVRISSRETEAIEGKASPRKPKVAIAVRSPSGIFEVACRSTESARSASSMPRPSSVTRIEAPAARLDRDVDRARAGVERVLDQFLDGRGRPLDHFAGGDAIDEQGIEAANRHGRSRPPYRTPPAAGPRPSRALVPFAAKPAHRRSRTPTAVAAIVRAPTRLRTMRRPSLTCGPTRKSRRPTPRARPERPMHRNRAGNDATGDPLRALRRRLVYFV